jgi:protein phosphatase
MGAYLVARQALSEQQAERAGLNHVLASAIGAPDMTPAVGVLDVAPGDVLLLCTDGLTRHVEDAEIAEVLGGPATPSRAAAGWWSGRSRAAGATT